MLLRPSPPDLRPIPWFDRNDHPFVPTCLQAERRAQWKSPRRGRSAAEHRALARLTERARRYTPKTRPTERHRPAGLPPRNVLDYRWGVPPTPAELANCVRCRDPAGPPPTIAMVPSEASRCAIRRGVCALAGFTKKRLLSNVTGYSSKASKTEGVVSLWLSRAVTRGGSLLADPRSDRSVRNIDRPAKLAFAAKVLGEALEVSGVGCGVVDLRPKRSDLTLGSCTRPNGHCRRRGTQRRGSHR